MLKRLRNMYRDSTLAFKIRVSNMIILVPLMILLVLSVLGMYTENMRYQSLLEAAGVASEFSLEFKEDFDYETYLVVVENKTLEESELEELLSEANRIVEELKGLTDSGDNLDRISSVDKYLDNLQSYIDSIALNLETGSRYEENMMIWENDVQIVTSLIQETFNEYIFNEIRHMQQQVGQLRRFNITFVGITGIGTLILLIITIISSAVIPRSITRPIDEISRVTRQVTDGDLDVRTHIEHGAEVRELGEDVNEMIDKLQELIAQVTREQENLRRAELELLQAQINPHFLYNTLDTIIWLAEAEEKDKVVGLVTSLSRFFRTSLNEGKDNITIEEELRHARSYLEIQQVRYQDILDYEIDVPAELYPYRIPKITLQPLVENALYHGIKNRRGKGTIRVTGEKREDCLCLMVSDDGIGIPPERLSQIRKRINEPEASDMGIYGLYNVNQRIRLRAGEGYGLQIDSRYEEGTVVTVRLPLVTEYLTDSLDSDSKNPDPKNPDSKNPDPKDPDSKNPEPRDTDSKEN